jgi:hypothetical protein
MASYQTNSKKTIDGGANEYIYEYEMTDEDGDIPFVETVSDEDDEDEYIEIEVTDDEDEDDRGALPPLPPSKRTGSISGANISTKSNGNLKNDSMDVANTNSSPKAPAPVAAPPAPPATADPSIMLTPSKQRAKAAGSAGLSELSKQLRILQAKNESQAVDINRLERQLRILADLQGISKY